MAGEEKMSEAVKDLVTEREPDGLTEKKLPSTSPTNKNPSLASAGEAAIPGGPEIHE